ncbi:MAG: hypothetical protein QXI11_01970 [Thermoproteota archaeon]
MLFEVEYGFGEIPANTKNLKFTFMLRPQPALLREVHAVGGPSTNFDLAIFDEEDFSPLHRIYQKLSANIEIHDMLWPHPAIMNVEKRYIYFLISNNDTVNPCRLSVRLVYEPSE